MAAFEESTIKGWAVVDSNGNLIRSKNVIAVAHHGTGSYILKFTAAVDRCSYSAHLDTDPGFIFLFPDPADLEWFDVTVEDFAVIIHAMRRTVVLAFIDARTARGSAPLDRNGQLEGTPIS